jgi:glutathione S-transferase
MAMKLYNSIGPSPRIARMAAAEKGIALELVEIDIFGAECRREPYLSINPLGALPSLETEQGDVITEVLAIAEYFEDLRPEPPLVGTDPLARAHARMWARRIDLGFAQPLTLGFRAAEGRAMFEPRLIVAPTEAAPSLKAMAFDMLDFLERQCAGRDYVASGSVTIGDLLLLGFVDFALAIQMTPLEGRAWLTAWHGRMSARPSASA